MFIILKSRGASGEWGLVVDTFGAKSPVGMFEPSRDLLSLKPTSNNSSSSSSNTKTSSCSSGQTPSDLFWNFAQSTGTPFEQASLVFVAILHAASCSHWSTCELVRAYFRAQFRSFLSPRTPAEVSIWPAINAQLYTHWKLLELLAENSWCFRVFVEPSCWAGGCICWFCLFHNRTQPFDRPKSTETIELRRRWNLFCSTPSQRLVLLVDCELCTTEKGSIDSWCQIRIAVF